MKKRSLSFVCLIVSFSFAFAQEKGERLPYNRWEIGINAGVANFAGSMDINKMYSLHSFNDFHSDFNFGYGLFVRKNFTNVFALEAAYNGTTLTGTPKITGYNPFKTGVNEFDLNTVWNLNNLFSRNKFDRKVYFYAKIGTGITHVNNIEYTEPATVQGPWRYWTFPFGTGLVVRLKENLRLDVGTQWCWVNTNSLDGVLQGGPLSGTGFMMGNIRERYLYTHAGISFMLGKKHLKPVPVVVQPKSQPKPEPKPEPKPVPPPALPKHIAPACVGQIYKIYFAIDKWDLNAEAKTELDRLAKEMQEYPEVRLEMKSHTDSRGPASYNLKLSEKRGDSVLDYMTSKGISASRVNAHAFGEAQPVNKCIDGVKCSEAEYAVNRRSEVLVIE